MPDRNHHCSWTQSFDLSWSDPITNTEASGEFLGKRFHSFLETARVTSAGAFRFTGPEHSQNDASMQSLHFHQLWESRSNPQRGGISGINTSDEWSRQSSFDLVSKAANKKILDGFVLRRFGPHEWLGRHAYPRSTHDPEWGLSQRLIEANIAWSSRVAFHNLRA